MKNIFNKEICSQLHIILKKLTALRNMELTYIFCPMVMSPPYHTLRK